jgi:hypothetical protein
MTKEEIESDTKQSANEGDDASPSSRPSPAQASDPESTGDASQPQAEGTLDLTARVPPPNSGLLTAPLPKLSDPEARRDWVRLIVTVGLLFILAIVVVWSCVETASWPDHWEHTKEMLQIILPALTGLIGSVLGFYFGSGGKSGGTSAG